MLLHLSRKYIYLKNYRCRWWGGWGLWHIRSAYPHGPLLCSISRTGRDTTTSRLLATWLSPVPPSKWSLLVKEAPLNPGTGLFCTVKWNPGCCLVLPALLEGKVWDNPLEDCCWACDRDQLISPYRQASLGGTTSLRPWSKGNCEAQTSQCCLEAELNTCVKIQAEFPTHLDAACPECHEPWEVIYTLWTQL